MGPKYVGQREARRLLSELGTEYAVVANPAYVHPPFELYPLAPKRAGLARGLAGVVMDMDGTTTTTEALCIHALETMVRRITGREDPRLWPGLDARDYPHIIGNSTTRHVEYLVRTYRDAIVPDAYRRHFLRAAAWTLAHAADEGRRIEVRADLAALGVGNLLADPRFDALQRAEGLDAPAAQQALDALVRAYGGALATDLVDPVVRAAIDIYYFRYHEILAALERGEGAAMAATVLGDASSGVIRPMPGAGVFLALVKGWLGADAAALHADLTAHLQASGIASENGTWEVLAALGRHFEQHPCRVAVVTSSIRYEARIVLGEVFRVLSNEIAQWPLPAAKVDGLVEKFRDFERYYDAFITASDSSEIRLKPHRDLYSIALHRLGIGPGDFDRVAGFEDSESGTIAIRAAGIGVCCALPFPETQGHQFAAASYVAHGGLPEVMLNQRVFLPPHARV
jgi:beta-phosphoglucomutase-like phosphatase (HAD superfamily)